MTDNRPIILWLFSGCFLIFVMVVVGGITRLTNSGLSMVDWNLFMGAIPPLNEAEWQKTFDLYKKTPEYQKINFSLIYYIYLKKTLALDLLEIMV